MVERVEAAALWAEGVAEHVLVQQPSALMVVPSVGLAANRLRQLVPVTVERLAAVTPPCVETIGEELVVGIRPVVAAGIGVEGVID